MSENTTQHLPNGSTFEERVFARFDAIDARLHALETQAEQRAFDTKPIWERALAELVEVKGELVEVKGELREVKQTSRLLAASSKCWAETSYRFKLTNWTWTRE